MLKLRPFQKRILAAARSAKYRTVAVSIPRGNSKSYLAGRMVVEVLTPGSKLFVRGGESVLAAASLEQARIVYKFYREMLEDNADYRFADSTNAVSITHRPSGARIRAHGSNAKSAMGLVNCPLVISDEPGSWEVNKGTLMHEAIQSSMGKPGSPLRAVYIGTLAPAPPDGWWPRLIEAGTNGSTFVYSLQGDLETWDKWPTIRRANPLTAVSEDFRKVLLEERDAARADSRKKATFCSYRLNLPSMDEATMLMSIDSWQRVQARPVPPRDGRPVGIDLGSGRAWTAAVAIWRNGRIEALAICPGLPSVRNQETRDKVPKGVYQSLVDSGRLRAAEGLRVPKPANLWAAIKAEWGLPEVIVADRYQFDRMQDAVKGVVPLLSRIPRFKESTEDIDALRSFAADGPLACEPESRDLLTVSLGVAMVKSDDGGSVRMVKRGSNNESRDDIAAALVLAAGALSRAPKRQRGRYLGAS